jgi:hypothetical protein
MESMECGMESKKSTFKVNDQYMAQAAKMQYMMDLRIMYYFKEKFSKELKEHLMPGLNEYLGLNEETIDAWLSMFRPVVHQAIIM